MDSLVIKLYAFSDSPRLKYIAGIILGDILGLSWEVVTDKRKLGKHPVINYSKEKINGSYNIYPVNLLFEKGIREQDIMISEWKNMPVFFQSNEGSDFPFDIFAASFYMISRYEEYLDFEADEHGRFTASSSLAFKNGFHKIPVIDMWVKELALALLKKFRSIAFRRHEYFALLTIDSDLPFAYRGRNIFRSVGGLIRDMSDKVTDIRERYKVVAGEKNDPYDVYDYIFGEIEKNNSDVRFFFPTGDYSKYDKNPSWKNTEYQKLINKTASKYIIGLHPAYYSSADSRLLTSELARLDRITSNKCQISRFHFVRLFTPLSYKELCKTGIKVDYSMGFHDEPGFRAGIARPFLFYDIVEELQTELKIVPFQIMDCTLYQYKKLDPAGAKQVIIEMINETRKVGGLFVSIWHNTSLLDDEQWQQWRGVFEFMLQYQQP
jgi:hypothetical protein